MKVYRLINTNQAMRMFIYSKGWIRVNYHHFDNSYKYGQTACSYYKKGVSAKDVMLESAYKFELHRTVAEFTQVFDECTRLANV